MSARPQTAPRRATRHRSLVLQAVLVGGVLVLAAVTLAGLVPGSGRRLADASATWLVVAVALELLAITAYVVLFHGVFSHGAHRVRRVRSAQIGAGELAGYVASPTGAGGPAIRIWALVRLGMPFREVMTRSVTHAAVFNIPYIAAALLLGAGAVAGVGMGHARTIVALAPVAVVIVSVAFTLGAARVARRPARSSARWRRIGRDMLEAIPRGVGLLPARLREPSLLPSATAYWICDGAVLLVALHAAHGSAGVTVVALAYMLGQLGNAVPLPGGVGGVEPVMLGVLTSSGTNLAVGAAAVVLYRFISLGLQAAIGAVALGTLVPRLQRPEAGVGGLAAHASPSVEGR